MSHFGLGCPSRRLAPTNVSPSSSPVLRSPFACFVALGGLRVGTLVVAPLWLLFGAFAAWGLCGLPCEALVAYSHTCTCSYNHGQRYVFRCALARGKSDAHRCQRERVIPFIFTCVGCCGIDIRELGPRNHRAERVFSGCFVYATRPQAVKRGEKPLWSFRLEGVLPCLQRPRHVQLPWRQRHHMRRVVRVVGGFASCLPKRVSSSLWHDVSEVSAHAMWPTAVVLWQFEGSWRSHRNGPSGTAIQVT